jgi:Questin oxidase-like
MGADNPVAGGSTTGFTKSARDGKCSVTTIDDALEILRETGPEFSSGLSNHGPMAAEALLRLGRAEAVIPGVEGYKRRLGQHPVPLDRVEPGEWRRALGNIRRVGDWIGLFDRALAEAPWPQVLHTWVPRLVPGVMAGATHGVIRTAHAVRSLDESENALRLHELAEGLGYSAARYQELPGRPSGRDAGLSPSLALRRVPMFHGTDRGRIFESVKAFNPYWDRNGKTFEDPDGYRVVLQHANWPPDPPRTTSWDSLSDH